MDAQNHTVILYSSGTVATNLNLPSFQKPSSGVMINVNSHNTFGSLKNTLQVLGMFCSISWTSFTSNLSRIEMRLVFSLAVDPEASFFSFLVSVIILAGSLTEAVFTLCNSRKVFIESFKVSLWISDEYHHLIVLKGQGLLAKYNNEIMPPSRA